MPNWCSTIIKFYSNNEAELRKMYEKFKDIQEGQPTQENDFGAGWMGDYANVYFPEKGAEKTECRGWVDGIDEIEPLDDIFFFTLWTETAWGPKIGLWNEIIKKFYPSVNIAYCAEEPGCSLFLVWDKTPGQKFFCETYYVDGCLPRKDGECEYIDDRYAFGDEDEIRDYLDKTLPFEYDHEGTLDDICENLETQLSRYEEEHPCNDCLYFQAEPFIEESPDNYDPFDIFGG